MSASIEYALITRIIQDQDFHTAEKLGVSSSFFAVPEMRNIFDFLQQTYHHPTTQGMIPSLAMVQQYYQSFAPAYAPDPVPILCEALRREKLRMDLGSLAENINSKKDGDPFSALGDLRVEAQRLSALAEVGQDLSMAGAAAALFDRYNLVASMKGVVGIPYPWEPLNLETQGMQGSQFIVLYGRPKSMKTWIAIYMAVHAYQQSRRRVLFYTREMSPFMIAQRVAATICQLKYKSFINGSLQPSQLDLARSVLSGLVQDEKDAAKHGHQPCFIITADRSTGGGGVNWLRAKIRDVRPDIVFVDGMYLMKDDRSNSRTVDWKNISHISQDLKLTGQEFDIPVVGVTKANRSAEQKKGEDLTELSYSDSLGQDADAVYRIRKFDRCDETTGGKRQTEIYVTAPGLREGVFEGIVLKADPAVEFSYQRMLTAADNSDENSYGDNAKKAQQAAKPGGASFSGKPQYMKTPKIGA